MVSITERIEQYAMPRVRVQNLRAKLTRPPRELLKGEIWDGQEITYVAGWIDETGAVREFGDVVDYDDKSQDSGKGVRVHPAHPDQTGSRDCLYCGAPTDSLACDECREARS